MSHVFEEPISLEDLAREFDEKLKVNLTEENIKKQMDNFETMDRVLGKKFALKEPHNAFVKIQTSLERRGIPYERQ